MSPKALIVAILAIFVIGCEAGPPVQTNIAQAEPVATPKVKKQVWPDVLQNVKVTSISPNLTTKNYVLVFDGSGSMADTCGKIVNRKIETAKEAARTWIKSVPADANVGLVSFHSQQGHWTKLPLSKDRQAFVNAINSVRAGGNTPLATAFKQAFNDLTLEGQSQLGYGEYVIVTITDGEADDIRALSEWVEYILRNSPIQIYTIGLCIKTNHTLYQPNKTTYKSADNPEELVQGLKDVLAESEDFVLQDFKK
jgi:Ca-activated chloride channel homolog